MPRPPVGRVGRSVGVAEHRIARYRSAIPLSHATFVRAAALGCVVALALAGVPSAATAQTPAGSVAGTRAAIDANANQWFAAQRESGALDLQAETLSRMLSNARHRVDQLRHVADARVVELYESSDQTFAGVLGNNPLDVGRRAELISNANAGGQVVIDQFEGAITELEARRHELASVRTQQARTLHELTRQRSILDAELASLQLHAAAHVEAVVRETRATSAGEAPTRPAPSR